MTIWYVIWMGERSLGKYIEQSTISIQSGINIYIYFIEKKFENNTLNSTHATYRNLIWWPGKVRTEVNIKKQKPSSLFDTRKTNKQIIAKMYGGKVNPTKSLRKYKADNKTIKTVIRLQLIFTSLLLSILCITFKLCQLIFLRNC